MLLYNSLHRIQDDDHLTERIKRHATYSDNKTAKRVRGQAAPSNRELQQSLQTLSSRLDQVVNMLSLLAESIADFAFHRPGNSNIPTLDDTVPLFSNNPPSAAQMLTVSSDVVQGESGDTDASWHVPVANLHLVSPETRTLHSRLISLSSAPPSHLPLQPLTRVAGRSSPRLMELR